MALGILHLFPTPLAPETGAQHVPHAQVEAMKSITHWIVETPKAARALLRQMMPDIDLQALTMVSIGKHEDVNPRDIVQRCLDGHDAGLISDAGMPAIADPGHIIVKAAHNMGIIVRPWPGPNSMLMALMASGFSGQSFKFHGYLPHDSASRKRQLQSISQAASRGESQIWMETPYRNGKHLQELCQVLPHSSRLTLACDLTASTEFIQTKSVGEWSQWSTPSNLDSLHKRPAVWVFGI